MVGEDISAMLDLIAAQMNVVQIVRLKKSRRRCERMVHMPAPSRPIRRPPPGCLHCTDRGSQYCAHDYQKLLRKHGFEVSMSGKGNCYDRTNGHHWFKPNGEVRRRRILQVTEGKTGLGA